MSRIMKFNVVPYLPEKLQPLMKIAYNLWWVWNYEAIELFRRLDIELWRELEHNPVKFLGSLSQKSLDEAAESESFLAHMERVEQELDHHMTRKSWFEENNPDTKDMLIAYFSAEFGLHESLPIYSGGLGVLAGDHLKSASELGIPLCGIGLLYRLGYFRQYLNFDGWQQERFPVQDFYNLSIHQVRDAEEKPLFISVEFPGRMVYAQIWKVHVGRVELYLLDTNIDKNSIEDRAITDQLYGGGHEMRVMQEIMLGIGGIRTLEAVGLKPTVYHMNEGHAAFMSLERILVVMKKHGLNYQEARDFVTASNVFTTHTPVPAGNDRFSPELIDQYFSHYYSKLGISKAAFMALGRENPDDEEETFCMTVLALKTAAYANGVSKLHGDVSRKMWSKNWPNLPLHEVPIGHITNGIQTLSWTSDEMMRLLNRYLGPRWIDNPADNSIWTHIDSIPDSELWRCRERLRERLVGYARYKLKNQLIARGVPPKEADMANSVLDPEALTIGFARRFATYKRATLIMRDLKRLYELLSDKERPMQIIFAGKAHPRDNMGKELIKQVIHITNDEKFRDKIVFLEDYDINLARYLVQGVDVWLNNPIRPKEASGTSGMKVVPNGGLNISILDGWWAEAYNSKNGWAIGSGEEYEDHWYQDEIESLSLYNILEVEVKPAFYNRGVDGLPKEWISRIRESMKSINPEFNSNRQVKDYQEKYYINAHGKYVEYTANDFAVTRSFSSWKKRTGTNWHRIAVGDISSETGETITVGSKIRVIATVKLGELLPDDVQVELYFGSLNQEGEIMNGAVLPMSVEGDGDKGVFEFSGQVLCLKSGHFGFTVRVIPHSKWMPRKFDPDLKITWA